MRQPIRGYFRMMHRGLAYDVAYTRAERQDALHGLQGKRILSLSVTEGSRVVMHYENRSWRQQPQTVEERELMQRIVDRVN